MRERFARRVVIHFGFLDGINALPAALRFLHAAAHMTIGMARGDHLIFY
jgi:hypothetical protein